MYETSFVTRSPKRFFKGEYIRIVICIPHPCMYCTITYSILYTMEDYVQCSSQIFVLTASTTGCLIWIWDVLKSCYGFVFGARHFSGFPNIFMVEKCVHFDRYLE